MSDYKPILCIDFDGVIHRYDSPWTDAVTISDGATDGFFEWAEQAAKLFRLVIYSSRSKDPAAIIAMQGWLVRERNAWRDRGGMHETDAPLGFEFADEKPPAFATIDDRAIQFNGDWSAINPVELRAFKPWNKRT